MGRSLNLNIVFIIDWLLTPIHWMTWNLSSAMKLRWTHQSPNLALSLKFIQDIQLPQNCQLSLLNFKALNIIKEQTSYFKDMELRENQQTEKKLLKASSLKWYPHQTIQVKMINRQGEPLCSRIFHGEQFSSQQVHLWKSEIAKLLSKAHKRRLVIEEIEIARSHPGLEVMIEYGNQSQFIFNGLSQEDQKLGEDLAAFLDVPVRIKAITPSANYSKLF